MPSCDRHSPERELGSERKSAAKAPEPRFTGIRPPRSMSAPTSSASPRTSAVAVRSHRGEAESHRRKRFFNDAIGQGLRGPPTPRSIVGYAFLATSRSAHSGWDRGGNDHLPCTPTNAPGRGCPTTPTTHAGLDAVTTRRHGHRNARRTSVIPVDHQIGGRRWRVHVQVLASPSVPGAKKPRRTISRHLATSASGDAARRGPCCPCEDDPPTATQSGIRVAHGFLRYTTRRRT